MGIAIMSCRKLINKCTGTGCFRSYYENIDSFSIYKEKNDILMSFFYCIGCKETVYEDENWKHKIKQLKNSGVDTIHIARCIEVECDDYSKHEKVLIKEGLNVVKGTHK